MADLPTASSLLKKRSRKEANSIFSQWQINASMTAGPAGAIEVSYVDLEPGEFPPMTDAGSWCGFLRRIPRDSAPEAIAELGATSPPVCAPNTSNPPAVLSLSTVAGLLSAPPQTATQVQPSPAALRVGLRALMAEEGIDTEAIAAALGQRGGARAIAAWLAISPFAGAEAAHQAAARWITTHAAIAAAARDRAYAATAHLAPDAQALYAETVARSAADSAASHARLEPVSVPVDAIPPDSPVAAVYAADIAAARAAAAAAAQTGGKGEALPATVAILLPGPEASALRRTTGGGDPRRLEAAVATLLTESARQSAWERAGRGGLHAAEARPAAAGGRAAVAVAAMASSPGGRRLDDSPQALHAAAPLRAASLSFDRWGQGHSSSAADPRTAAPLLWAPLTESAPLRAHGAGLLDAALIARFLALPAGGGAVGLGDGGGGSVAMPLAGPGSDAVAAYLGRVFGEAREAASRAEAAGTASSSRRDGLATAAPVSAADAVARVVRALGAFASARVAESSSRLLRTVTLLPPPAAPGARAQAAAGGGKAAGGGAGGGSEGVPAELVRTGEAVRPPPPPSSSIRLYTPGTERGAMLFGAVTDAAKSTLRVCL